MHFKLVVSRCVDCGGASICQRNRREAGYKDCGGTSICQHNRGEERYKDCGGTSICQRNRQRSRYKDCESGRRPSMRWAPLPGRRLPTWTSGALRGRARGLAGPPGTGPESRCRRGLRVPPHPKAKGAAATAQ